jgi:hypothetical protein
VPSLPNKLAANAAAGSKTPAGRAVISAANTKHGRYKTWREKRSKGRYYQSEIKRVMREAELAGHERARGKISAVGAFLDTDGIKDQNNYLYFRYSSPGGPTNFSSKDVCLGSIKDTSRAFDRGATGGRN